MNIHIPLMETPLVQDSYISELVISDSADKAFPQHHISGIKLIVLLYVSVFRICQANGCAGDWDDSLEADAFAIDLLISILVIQCISSSSPVNLHLPPTPHNVSHYIRLSY